MSRWMLAAGVAALAIASPTLAQKGGQGGKGGGDKKEHSGHVMKSDRGGGGGDKQVERQSKGRGGDKVSSKPVHVAQTDRGRGGGKGDKETRPSKDRTDDHGRGHGKVQVHDDVRVARFDDDKVKGHARNVRFDDDDDFRFVPHWNERGLARGFVNGCPPGLAMKGNGCLPPGQAKKLVGTVLAPTIMSRSLAGPYRLWYRDDDDFMYRWDDDYIYRVRRDGGLIDALFPYSNNDYYYYPVGAPYPSYFNYYNVPYQYQSFYPNGGDYAYRYGDGAIYMVDPQTQAIQGIAALLTGAPMAVGQPLPPSYGVYNVPLSYRSTYFDTPDAMYRYNDGYIYRVDPTTMLITSVINALV